MKTTELDLSAIVLDPELQPREMIDHDTVTQYAEDMLAGIKFPPVIVYYDGNRHWLSQGWHRWHAAEAASLETITAEVREGTRDDARWDAAGSNREHDCAGQRRKNEDKRRAVRMALEAKPNWSTPRIADHVGVSQPFVLKIRQAITVISSTHRVEGADGKSYPASNVKTYPVDVIEIGRKSPNVNGLIRAMVCVRCGLAFADRGSHYCTSCLSRNNQTTPETILPGDGFSLDSSPEPVKPVSNPTFNQTNEMVDWAKWTWNPVTGCEHNCVYCYARDIANRFYPEKFEPTYRPDRLAAPRNTKLPGVALTAESPVDRTAWRNVFVCSMADLFGRWVPDEWINGVFDACRAAAQWNYLFLTKFPNRYVDLDFPANSWVGTSVDEQKRVANAEKSFAKLDAPVKWLSVEPMREPIKFKDLSVFNWVVIGGQSRSSGAPEFFPDPFWVAELITEAHKAGCKVYCKPNTDPNGYFAGLIREYPDAFGVAPSNAAGLKIEAEWPG